MDIVEGWKGVVLEQIAVSFEFRYEKVLDAWLPARRPDGI